MARYNTIDQGPVCEQPQTQEGLASVAITPGKIVYRNAGEFAIATAALAVDGRRLFIADHNWAAGGDNDTDNASGDTMIAQIPLPRKNYAALLAAGQNVTAVDAPLTVTGTAGELAVGTVGTDNIVAYAQEVFNNTGSDPELIAIRWAFD